MILPGYPCEISADGLYRYTLWRYTEPGDSIFGVGLPERPRVLMIVGLNPSTADATKDDNTIRRCVGFARHWKFDALAMLNLFAWRATDPAAMLAAEDPVGPGNNARLVQVAGLADMILCAWGKHGAHRGRAGEVLAMLPGEKLRALRRNKDGSPMHPLYVPKDTYPITYPR